MKKIIWLVFAVFAALWTGLVALSLQLSDWLLSSVASARLPDTLPAPDAWTPPAWAEPWVGSGLVESLQGVLVGLMQTVNHVLPAAGSLGTFISVLGWLIWGLVMAGMLLVAGGLHWLAGRHAAQQQQQAQPQAPGTPGQPRLPS